MKKLATNQYCLKPYTTPGTKGKQLPIEERNEECEEINGGPTFAGEIEGNLNYEEFLALIMTNIVLMPMHEIEEFLALV